MFLQSTSGVQHSIPTRRTGGAPMRRTRCETSILLTSAACTVYIYCVACAQHSLSPRVENCKVINMSASSIIQLYIYLKYNDILCAENWYNFVVIWMCDSCAYLSWHDMILNSNNLVRLRTYVTHIYLCILHHIITLYHKYWMVYMYLFCCIYVCMYVCIWICSLYLLYLYILYVYYIMC